MNTDILFFFSSHMVGSIQEIDEDLMNWICEAAKFSASNR